MHAKNNIITTTELTRLLKTAWQLTSISQVIDGVSYWLVENNEKMERRLVAIRDCDDAGIHPNV